MATTFKNKVIKEVGISPIIAIETNAATRSTIVSISLANITGGIIYASIMVKSDDSVVGYFLKDVLIPPGSSLRALSAGEKLILAPDNQLLLIADQDAGYDAIISYVDIV
jgi:hypothetical protein